MAKACINGVIGGDLTERIGRNRTLGEAIHFYISHMIAGLRCDGEGLVGRFDHIDRAAR
jgi:hypothetical protein